MSVLAERFHRLFAGLERSHGRYVIPPGAKPGEKNKLHDRSWARTVEEPLTVDVWERHLEGQFGLGIVPIRDDATCVFGALDVDVYPLDLKGLVAAVKKLEFPCLVCRTKSGGAHIFLFIKGGAPAELVRSKMMDWAVQLGFPGIEVFPKQTRLAGENDHGSWINMPYHSGKRSTRYGIKADGSSMTQEEFVDAAEKIAITEDTLRGFEPAKDESLGDMWDGAPPCLQTLAKKGFGDWQNNGMFNVSVYLRKRFGDAYQVKVDDYNRRVMDPPLSSKDVAAIVKSVSKKTYSYMCKQEPICGVCNKQVCLTREFGVGGANDDPGVVFGELVKLETEPPTWIWDVDGARLELTTDDLTDQRKFMKLAIEKLNKWPNAVKPGVWRAIVRERLARVETTKVPEDATREGQFWVHLARFCTSRVAGKSLDELLLGKPYTKDGRTYFCSSDLFQYLTQHRFASVTEKEVFRWLRKRSVEHHKANLKGKFVNYWSVPAFEQQTEEHDVPRSKETERM